MKKIKTIVFLIFIALLSYTFNYLYKNIELSNSNSDFIKEILQESNYHLNYNKNNINIFSKFISLVNNIEIDEPVTILENGFSYDYGDYLAFSYITNTVVDNPRVYIYNTHPTEMYNSDYLEGYDISPGVLMASMMLQEKLNSYGINTLLEQNSTIDYIKDHNLTYDDTYVASREFLTNTLKEYPNLELIIDLHRDAIEKSVTTTTINGENYAKLMFVQNTDCTDNYNLANELNDLLESEYPTISRGIYTKHQSKFNQDLNPNVLLIEVGGNYNTIEEVENTIDALANVIKEKLQ